MLAVPPMPASPPACPVSQVRYGARDHLIGDGAWLRGQPASSGLVVVLAYWPQEWRRRRVRGARIYTGGEMPQGWTTKAVWAFIGRAQRNRGGDELVVRGTRLDARGRFTQRFGAIGYAGQDGAPSFASTIDVPKAGCWRLDASTAKLRSSVVVRAITAPAASRRARSPARG
jgi:hypothetical protein